MTANSAAPGYLLPDAAGPAPLEGQALQRFLQQVVVGVTGMPGPMVRPRWQVEPPDIPQTGSDWCAIGVTARRKGAYASVLHNPPGLLGDQLYRQQELDLLASFYGPNAESFAEIWCDGLAIAQNREQMQLAGFNIDGLPGDPVTVPQLLKQAWLMRIDVPVTFVRIVQRKYSVLDLAAADITVITDDAFTEGRTSFHFIVPPS